MLGSVRGNKGNLTLVGLFVAVAIIAILCVVLFRPLLFGGSQAERQGLVHPKHGQTVLGASVDKAKETQCSSNLRQIRMSIDAYKAENGQPPANLQALKLPVSSSFPELPVSGQPYRYDPVRVSLPALRQATRSFKAQGKDTRLRAANK